MDFRESDRNETATREVLGYDEWEHRLTFFVFNTKGFWEVFDEVNTEDFCEENGISDDDFEEWFWNLPFVQKKDVQVCLEVYNEWKEFCH